MFFSYVYNVCYKRGPITKQQSNNQPALPTTDAVIKEKYWSVFLKFWAN